MTKLLQKSKTLMWKGLDLSNNVCEYEINWLSNEKVIRGKQNFNVNCKL